jgi:hypothetical protein
MNYLALDQQHLWIGGLLFFVFLLAALEVGYRTGIRRHDEWTDGADGGGNLVLTSIFTLLGLILAFTFADGVSHYKTRKQAVVTEVNALRTAFMRADLVAEPGRTELKRALLEYASTRTVEDEALRSPDRVRQQLEASSRKLAVLWPTTLRNLQQEPSGPSLVPLIAAVNGVIDFHLVRNTALFDRLPGIVLTLLVLIAAAALAVAGFNAALSGRMSRWRMTIFAMVLVGVVFVIRDFDRPLEGFILVSLDSVHALITEMEANLTK